MTAVRLEQVRFRYPAGERDALDGVTLACDGGITWLYGRLGAGCSTLLLVAAGLAPEHTGGSLEGRVAVLGEDPASPEGRRRLAGRIGFVTATPSVQLSGIAATVREEVAFAPANLGWPVARIRAGVDAALERLGVAHLAERDPATLSGGELQRVILASMLVLDPAVWLLDDPAPPLDAAGRAQLAALLREQAARGATILIASEDADALLELADRAVLLARGRVVADAAPREVLGLEAAWRDGPGGTTVTEVARAAAALAPDRVGPPWPLTVADAAARWDAGRRR